MTSGSTLYKYTNIETNYLSWSFGNQINMNQISETVKDNSYDDIDNYISLKRETLTESQKSVFDEIVNNDKTQKLYYISGCAGTGKSYLLKTMSESLFLKYKIETVLLAFSGVAAHNIGGRTIHSFFRIPVTDDNTVLDDMVRHTPYEDVPRESKNYWIIIDEVSMMSYKFLRLIDLLLRQQERVNKPFGGMNILLFGDLMQLKPISKDDSMYCFQKPYQPVFSNDINEDPNYNVWNMFAYRKLTQNVRQKGDRRYEQFLNNIRIGVANAQDIELIKTRVVPIEGLFDENNSIRLYPKNKDVDNYNEEMIRKIQNDGVKIFTVYAEDRIVGTKLHPSSNALHKEVNYTGGIPKILKLGVNVRVMLKKNFCTEKGLCNGVVGTIKALTWTNDKTLKHVVVQFDDESVNGGKAAYIKACTVRFPSRLPRHPDIERCGFPFILAWAITVHKSQGLTFKRMVISIDENFFEKGQVYVALSRVQTLDSLAITNLNVDVILNEPHDKQSLRELNRLNRLNNYSEENPNTQDDLIKEQCKEENDNNDIVYMRFDDFYCNPRKRKILDREEEEVEEGEGEEENQKL